MEEDK